MSVSIGIDIGATSVRAAAVDPTDPQTPLAHRAQPVRRGADGITGSISEVCSALLADPALHGAAADSVGIGVPGVVNDGRVSHAVNLGIGAEAVDLAAHVRTLAGEVTVVVENDVNAAAWGAARWLAAQGDDGDDLALLNVGTGLAAGLVLDGRLRRGAGGTAGEIGHLPRDPHGPVCACGRRGCLEIYASGGGLNRVWPGTARELCAAAEAGDADAERIRVDLLDNLAHAVYVLVQTIDVGAVVVTGGVMDSTPALRAALVERLKAGDSPFEQALGIHQRLRWLPAEYPAGAVGSALLAAQRETAWK